MTIRSLKLERLTAKAWKITAGKSILVVDGGCRRVVWACLPGLSFKVELGTRQVNWGSLLQAPRKITILGICRTGCGKRFVRQTFHGQNDGHWYILFTI